MEILAVITQQVKEIFSFVVADTPASLETLETEVLAATRELGKKVLEACVYETIDAASTDKVFCPACQQPARRLRKRSRRVKTLCGKIDVSRWMYRCPAGHQHSPWEVPQRLKEGYTPGAAAAMCRLSARLDFRDAAEALAHQGITVSHTTLQQKVQRWAAGRRVSDFLEAQKLEVGSRWYVSCSCVRRTRPMAGMR